MIDAGSRFMPVSGGDQRVGRDGKVSYACSFADYDLRRVLLVMGEAASIEETNQDEFADSICNALPESDPHINSDQDIVELGSDYKFMRTRTETPLLDFRLIPNHPRLSETPSLSQTGVVRRSQLIEVDRLQALVDQLYYITEDGARYDVVGKYYFMEEHRAAIWKELHIWQALPRHHPNIVPFDRVIIDDLEDRIVGFTSVFVSSGNVEDHAPGLIKFEWIRQLTSLVDDLNFVYGIWHRDIHPRNVVIDQVNDQLQIFDFDTSELMSQSGGRQADVVISSEDRSDTSGAAWTIYELLTRDMSHRTKEFGYPDLSIILDLDVWALHPDVALDHDVSAYRRHLTSWLDSRTAATGRISSVLNFIPPLPNASSCNPVGNFEVKVQASPGHSAPSGVFWGDMRDFSSTGLPRIEWQRLPQDRLVAGTTYLMNGRPLMGKLQPVDMLARSPVTWQRWALAYFWRMVRWVRSCLSAMYPAADLLLRKKYV